MLMMCVSVLKANEVLLVFTYALHAHAHAGSLLDVSSNSRQVPVSDYSDS